MNPPESIRRVRYPQHAPPERFIADANKCTKSARLTTQAVGAHGAAVSYNFFSGKLAGGCAEDKGYMNPSLPRPVSPLTGELSRHWHRDSRPPLIPEISEPNDGDNWKASVPTSVSKGNRRRILLVDDDPTIREVTKLLLEKGGYEVVTAKDGVTGLLAFAANPNFAAVITDLRMPRADGRNLITALRAQAPHGTLPIICITGILDGAQDTEVFKRKMGIDTVLLKPFSHAALLASLERGLRSG